MVIRKSNIKTAVQPQPAYFNGLGLFGESRHMTFFVSFHRSQGCLLYMFKQVEPAAHVVFLVLESSEQSVRECMHQLARFLPAAPF